MDYEDFRKSVVKADKKKHKFKVTNSNGTKEAWRWLKKNKWLNIGQEVSERDFGLIVKALNQTFQDQLLSGKDVKLPKGMGRLEVRKFETKVLYKDHKVVTNLPIDWKRTIELWFEDEESRLSKTKVRFEIPEKFTVYYNRKQATYENNNFYHFIPTRTLRRRLRDIINTGKFDALLIGKRNELY